MSIDWPEGPLLLLLDFDGCLVDIAPTPDAVVVPDALPPLLDALQAAGHEVWIVTGRDRAFIRARLGAYPCVGLHGIEWPDEPLPPRSPGLDEAKAALANLEDAGGIIEDKGLAVAFHYRQVRESKEALRARIEAKLEEIVRARPELGVLYGHEMRELRPRAASKANAVTRLLERYEGRAAVYLGDDVTDEEAMAVLRAGDLAVRVGEGETCARARLADPATARAALRSLID